MLILQAPHLIFFTNGFPFGSKEVFIENELAIISQYFEKVTIFSLLDFDELQAVKRTVPAHCEVLPISPKRLKTYKALQYVFSPHVWKEVIYLAKHRLSPFSILNIKTILVAYVKAKLLYQITKPYIDKNTVGYAYWSDFTALSLTFWPAYNRTLSRCHGWDLYFDVHPNIYLPFRERLIQKLHVVASVSVYGKRYIQSVWTNKTLDHVIVARLGVKPQAILTQPNRNLIFSCSALIAIKRLELIIEALKRIPRPIQWVHAGDGELEERLKQAASDPALAHHRITFLGHLKNDDIIAFIKNRQPGLFINTSASEGIPVSIMEAMSFGVPSIAPDVGGVSEIINNRNGCLLPADVSPDMLASEIVRFLEMDEKTYQTYSTQAYLTWQELYNNESNYKQFGELLTKSSR